MYEAQRRQTGHRNVSVDVGLGEENEIGEGSSVID